MASSPNFLQGLTGAFGDPIAENPTQAMIEPAYRALGLDWRYLTVQVRAEGLADAVRGARAMGWKGFNCTIPHKVAVVSLLDELTPAAKAIGAVNCVIIRDDGSLLGDNTDGKGFLRSLEEIRPARGLNAVILGAGGAARAVAIELGLAGAARITIVNRTRSRGEELARLVEGQTDSSVEFIHWEENLPIPGATDLLVNATSIGLYPDVDAQIPVDLGPLKPGSLVCDVIPNPPRTRLLRDAEAMGCMTLDGLGMLVNQGAIGIRHWTGQDPDVVVMRNALEEIFSS